MKIYNSNSPNEDKVKALLRLSTIERETDSYSSIKNAKKAIRISRKIPDKSFLIRSYTKLGITYRGLDSLDKALDNFLKGLEVANETDDKKWQSNCLNHLGSSYLQYGQNKIALKYYQESYQIATEQNDSIALCNALNNIGIVHWRANTLDSSFNYIHKSMIISRDLKDSAGLVSSFNNLGMLQSELGDLKRALGYYNQAFMLATKLNDKWEIANVINNLSVMKIKLGLLDDVESELKKALVISSEIKSSLLESDTYFNLSEYYLEIKDYEKSLVAFKKHHSIKTKLINEETSDKIASLEKDFEIRSKDRNLEKLSEANNIQYYLIILLAALLVLVGTLIFIYFRKFSENKSLSVELKKNNTDLERLSDERNKFFTLISHDLKAPIYNISNLSNLMKMYAYDMDEAERNTTLDQLNVSSKHLLSLVDNILLWARTQVGNMENNPEPLDLNGVITESIDILSSFASEKDIELVMDTSDTDGIGVRADYNLLSTAIRNLISNAIKFSYRGHKVEIRTTSINGDIKIDVIDTGIGIANDIQDDILKGNASTTLGTNNEKGSGLGLKITKEFIEMTDGQITLESQEGKGATFSIILPKDKN
ncbi:MAG: tetratricopeptide repeat-containing sensor histidine kinase [Candidatus Kapaibacterium sp.]